jgi:hypothetical protein
VTPLDLTKLKSFSPLFPMIIHKYQDLVPDQDATILDKVNSIIQSLNQVGKLTNDVVKDWNTVYQWAMNDGLTQNVSDKLEDMLAKGEFDSLIANIVALVGDVTQLTTTDKSTIVGAVNELESTKANQTDLTALTTRVTTNETNIGLKANQTDLTITNTKVANLPTSIHNSPQTISKMIDVAQTYMNNISMLEYGNIYTAYDTTVQLDNGRYQIDCSSFVNLLLHGVTYENSRYNGNSQNIGTNYFFPSIDGMTYRLSNQIAQYAVNNGYTFTPNADFSNLEPGDVCFFRWNAFDTSPQNYTQAQIDFHNNAFMKIDHIGVFLHKKNEGIYNFLEFDSAVGQPLTTVYYDANPTYMSQCILVARFPYANISSIYAEDNLLLQGDTAYNVTNNNTIATYNLSKPLVQGRYYTFFVNGNITTPSNSYFVLQVNGTTVYSDYLKVLPYTGVTALRFAYQGASGANTISLTMAGTSPSGSVTWASLYEGYKRGIKDYAKSFKSAILTQFSLDPTLVSDLDSNMAPYYYYGDDGNKIFINFSLPLKTGRTGSLTIGTIQANLVKTTQRIPCNLIDGSNNAINAILQINSAGTVSIIPFSNTVTWSHALISGVMFKN